MRRNDRAVTDAQKIKEIILACDCCRLGFADSGSVYIVPLNFGYEEQGDKKVFYFHSATAGRKIKLVKKIGFAGFELDTSHRLNAAASPCEYSFSYQSVIGEGSVHLVEAVEEKKKALRLIMAHYSPEKSWVFSDDMPHAVAIIKLEVAMMTCKEHL